jgi:intracellular sulfur oxidation DsrE/DsrF family protein
VALKNNHVDKSQLLPGVETVPDGIYEIISKQKQGWGYIKAVH